jgi:membrane-associated protease RseP (regulator of RpoE activity)
VACTNPFMSAAPPLPAFVLAAAVVVLPLILVHEIGHAIAARLRLRAPVRMTVGNVGKVLSVRAAGIEATVAATASPLRFGGHVLFDASRAQARDVLVIALPARPPP